MRLLLSFSKSEPAWEKGQGAGLDRGRVEEAEPGLVRGLG